MKSMTTRGVLVLSTLLMGAGRAQTVREACAADSARLCPEARDAQSRIQCMTAHRDEVSDGCRRAYEASKATPKADAVSGGADRSSAAEPLTGATAAPADLDSIASRIAGRDFPSIFAPWNIAENLRETPDGHATPLASMESQAATRARHDLYFSTWSTLGLKLAPGADYVVLKPEFTPESVQVALGNRAKLLAANPQMLILTDLHYFSAPKNYLPADSPWWKHDTLNDRFERHNLEYHSSRLDFSNPEFQDKLAALCGALLRTGVYDGCMLDWWHDDDAMGADRLALIKKIRAAIGEKAILIGNVNGRLPTRTARYLNGMYMEGMGSKFFPDWRTAATNLIWGESHLRKPGFTALEAWWQNGRGDYASMRAATTLSLVFSNGYVLFSDPNELPTPDHLHDWYPFWDKSLGKAAGPVSNPDRPDLSGAYTRQFEKGEAVFNPPSNHPVRVTFPEPRRSAATGTTGRSFTVAAGDGDLFLNIDAQQRQ